jgi:putative lysine transport system permease protein
MPMMLVAAAAERNFFEWILFYITKYWPMFLDGTAITLLLSLTGTIFGFVIGLAIGVIRTIPENPRRPVVLKILIKIVNFLLAAYIEIFRGTPMMVQAMVIFYGIPTLTGIHLPTIPAGIFIISINTGAYLAEIVRGGIISIDKGQYVADSLRQHDVEHRLRMRHAE